MFNWWNYKTLQWASYESSTGVEVSMRKEGQNFWLTLASEKSCYSEERV